MSSKNYRALASDRSTLQTERNKGLLITRADAKAHLLIKPTAVEGPWSPLSNAEPSPILFGETPDPFSSPFAIPPAPLHKVTLHSSPHHAENVIAQEEGSAIFSVFLNFVNSIVGAGIVGLPFTLKQGGLAVTLGAMVVMAWLTDYSLRLIVRTAKYANVNTYEDLCEYCFGNMGFYLVSGSMFLFDFGAMLTYLIIMGDAAENLAGAWLNYSGKNVRRYLIIGISGIVMLPLCLLRDISKLEKASALSVLTVILINFIVIYKYFELGDKHKEERIEYINSEFPSAFGTIAFAFVCQDCAFLMFNTLKNPTTKRWGSVVHLSLGGACVVCIAFALFGYLTFKGTVTSNLLNDYSPKDKVVQAARTIYVLTMALTYPISFYVCRHVIYAVIYRGPTYKSEKECSLLTHLGITLPLYAVSVLIVMFVTNLGVVMSLTGSIAAVFLAFLLPAACRLKTQPSPLQFWLYKRGCLKGLRFVGPSLLLFLFGVLCMVASTGQTLSKYIQF